jgi:tRNA dimethylallyltransferase
MIEEGFSEIIYIFNKFTINKKQLNFELGVLQSIGYKEFYDLYKLLDVNLINDIYTFHLKEINSESNNNIINYNKNILENIINKNIELKNMFNICRQKLINNTLNYAKYQIKFIKKRILPFIDKYQIIEINEYSKDIYNKEYIPKIIDYLNNDQYVININGDININKIENWKKYYCDICNCELNGENEYNSHMKSNKHKKKKDNLRKKEKQQKNLKEKKDIDKIENQINKINIDDKE